MHALLRKALVVGATGATALGLAALQPAAAAAGDCRPANSDDLQVTGLARGGRLICFGENSPGDERTIGVVRLAGDTRLVGIDYRPASGDLYGLGNRGGIYVIDDTNASATKRAQMDVSLDGAANYGVDFNPAVDRLRVTSGRGQNLRVNVDTGATLVDGTLTYPANPPTVPAATTATQLTAAAYTNNDADPNTATTLYDVDTNLDQVVIQSPANSGLVAPTGKLGVDAGRRAGFDIYSTVRDGSTVDVEGYASLSVGGRTVFYEVTLFNGKVSAQGTFDADDVVLDVALPLNQR